MLPLYRPAVSSIRNGNDAEPKGQSWPKAKSPSQRFLNIRFKNNRRPSIQDPSRNIRGQEWDESRQQVTCVRAEKGRHRSIKAVAESTYAQSKNYVVRKKDQIASL